MPTNEKLKHSPGPWRIETDSAFEPPSDTRRIVSQQEYDNRARVWPPTTARLPYLATVYSLPDARLIAAAPEMLELLRAHNQMTPWTPHNLAERTAALLKRIDGEQP